jgi:hypothetical protein
VRFPLARGEGSKDPPPDRGMAVEPAHLLAIGPAGASGPASGGGGVCSGGTFSSYEGGKGPSSTRGMAVGRPSQ